MGSMKEGNKKIRWLLIEAANTASSANAMIAQSSHCNYTCCKQNVYDNLAYAYPQGTIQR